MTPPILTPEPPRPDTWDEALERMHRHPDRVQGHSTEGRPQAVVALTIDPKHPLEPAQVAEAFIALLDELGYAAGWRFTESPVTGAGRLEVAARRIEQ